MDNDVATKVWAYLGELLLCGLAYLLLVMAVGEQPILDFLKAQYLWVGGGFLANMALQTMWWQQQRSAMNGGFRDWLRKEGSLNFYRMGFNWPIITSFVAIPVLIAAGMRPHDAVIHIAACVCIYCAVNTFTMFRNLDAFNELAETWRSKAGESKE